MSSGTPRSRTLSAFHHSAFVLVHISMRHAVLLLTSSLHYYQLAFCGTSRSTRVLRLLLYLSCLSVSCMPPLSTICSMPKTIQLTNTISQCVNILHRQSLLPLLLRQVQRFPLGQRQHHNLDRLRAQHRHFRCLNRDSASPFPHRFPGLLCRLQHRLHRQRETTKLIGQE